MPIAQPPLDPTFGIVRDAKDIAEQEKRERKRQEDERREAINAEVRRKASESGQH